MIRISMKTWIKQWKKSIHTLYQGHSKPVYSGLYSSSGDFLLSDSTSMLYKMQLHVLFVSVNRRVTITLCAMFGSKPLIIYLLL
ncbi:hypothetical protein HanRHA438_Chr04g0193181 [Helianthus annuus]|nr:hypothetical protein HanHA300_Chr04g0150081 [Helianthus annuus]KAJ0598221.1 hypothetical protein HanHA89_Chr04g0163391 [Helianthus annuus]KAJ0758854.1 hypothetical protein HanLR1_Chr04g0154991 [Helianthus annuus]KAJ0762502.1 hypothetical protein HanOQP8_Chr04g0162061 [Helianthus annuus]KAJ0928359.1 hypothetical protein HanRHA438_Chr04g0193181 [Helianthus annuus]